MQIHGSRNTTIENFKTLQGEKDHHTMRTIPRSNKSVEEANSYNNYNLHINQKQDSIDGRISFLTQNLQHTTKRERKNASRFKLESLQDFMNKAGQNKTKSQWITETNKLMENYIKDNTSIVKSQSMIYSDAYIRVSDKSSKNDEDSPNSRKWVRDETACHGMTYENKSTSVQHFERHINKWISVQNFETSNEGLLFPDETLQGLQKYKENYGNTDDGQSQQNKG